MFGQIVAVATVVLLCSWHMKTRTRPEWKESRNGRFFVTLGYPSVTFAMYWLTQATVTTSLEWTLGVSWAFVAMIFFVYGFESLALEAAEQQSAPRPDQSAARPPIAFESFQRRTDDRQPAREVARPGKGSRHRRG
jgi:predicted membrane channel-forming protein YqfA (hemolysin III family)